VCSHLNMSKIEKVAACPKLHNRQTRWLHEGLRSVARPLNCQARFSGDVKVGMRLPCKGGVSPPRKIRAICRAGRPRPYKALHPPFSKGDLRCHDYCSVGLGVRSDLRVGHLIRIDQTIEVLSGDVTELEGRLLEGQTLRVGQMGDLGRLVIADDRTQGGNQHQ